MPVQRDVAAHLEEVGDRELAFHHLRRIVFHVHHGEVVKVELLVVVRRNPPEIAYWERGEWWLAGDPKPWQPEAVTVVSDRLVFKPRLAPVA